MSQIQIGKTEELWVLEAQSHRAMYRDEKGILRYNPIHVAALAEKTAVDGALGAAVGEGAQDTEAISGSMCALTAGSNAAGEPALPGSRGILSLRRRSELTTTALGSSSGRRGLLGGIRQAIATRLGQAGIAVDLLPYNPAQPVQVLASHSYTVKLFEPASCNPRFSPAESAAAVLSATILRQMDLASDRSGLHLQVEPVDDYAGRTFGWSARVVRIIAGILPGPEAEIEGAGAKLPSAPERRGVPSYRVFMISGGSKVSVQVPGGPPLLHMGGTGSRTVWNALLTAEETSDLISKVGLYAEIREVGEAPQREAAAELDARGPDGEPLNR